MAQDVRFGVRMLRKSPAFSVVAVLALALGVGANATVFTWLRSVLLEPLPGVADSGRLVTLGSARGEDEGYSTSFRDYRYIRDHSRAFSGLTAYELAPVNLAAGGRPEIVTGGLVTGDYFRTLGVKPYLGRWFLPEEARVAGGEPVVVLSHQLWRRRFGGDRHLLGHTVSLNRHPFTVVAVAPADFLGSYGGIGQDLWVPITTQPLLTPGGDEISTGTYQVQITGRLLPGMTLARAQADLAVLSRQLARAFPNHAAWREVVYPLARSQRGLTSSLVPVVEVLMAVAGIVLLICCLNVASLLLARSLARRREITIRLALGVSRGRLVRQLLTESLLLAALGGLAGIGIAAVTARTLPALLPPLGIPLGIDLSLDSRVLAFTAVAALATALLFGLVPALQTSRLDTASALKESGTAVAGGRRHSALRNTLIVLQLALSLVALIAAGLVGKSLLRSMERPTGFAPDHLLLTSFDVFLDGYERERGADLYRRLLDRVRGLPGVTAASLTDYAPLGLTGGGNLWPVEVPGYVAKKDEDVAVVLNAAGPAYLQTLGIGLAAGRDFRPEDRVGAPGVAILNETMARRFFPRGAVGRHLDVAGIDREVIGVLRDYKYRSLTEDPSPQILVPFFQAYRSEMTLVVRTRGDPLATLPAVRRVAAALAPGLPQFQTMTFTQRLGHSLFDQRLAARLLAAFGVLAATLAAIGLFGLMAYFVAQRPREIGIRMALGARRGQVLGMVLRHGLRLVAAGIVLGLAGSAAITRFLQSLLLGVSPLDVGVFGGVAAGLALVALCACFLPASRAADMEPLAALRHE